MRPVLLAALLILPAVALAQSVGDFTTASSPFTISVNPQYPAPQTQVTLSFLSSSIDLASATMTIVVGDRRVYQGAVHPFAVTLGRAGSITDILVTMSLGGTNYSQTVSIQPQDVVLIAEPVSSVPPLYPGKSSVPIEGSVRVVAVANLRSSGGTALNPSSLSYSWTVDGTQIANSSGVGKDTIIVASPLQYRGRTVSVAVANQNGDLVGGSSIFLSSADPFVRIYENDPLLGIRFDRALSESFAINRSEMTLYAAPFGLSVAGGSPLLRWFLNGEAAQTGSLITLRPAGSGRGNASLSLVASSGDFTQATTDISLSFGTISNTNFFGL